MRELLKDFAGPFATVFAATVAAVITFKFSRAQTKIAQSQRDIALDRLKFDLLQRRYEIYNAAKELLEFVPFVTELRKSDPSRVRSLYMKLEEASFYFPQDVCTAVQQIHDQCESFFNHLGARENINIDDHEKWVQMAEVLAADQKCLRTLFASLPKVFEQSLAFKQLIAG
jgi:hypothetical protein